MQKSKFALVLTLIALCCFVFAGTALADGTEIGLGTLETYIDGKTVGYTGCPGEYIFETGNIWGFTTDCMQNNGFTLKLDFSCRCHDNYRSFVEDDYSLPVKIWAAKNQDGTDGAWYFSQPTVRQYRDYEVVLEVENLQIAPEHKYITKIIIGDDNQNLRVTNPCEKGLYCVDLILSCACGTFKVNDTFEIKSAPAYIWMPYTSFNDVVNTISECNTTVEIDGKVFDCGGKAVAGQTLDIYAVNVMDLAEEVSAEIQRICAITDCDAKRDAIAEYKETLLDALFDEHNKPAKVTGATTDGEGLFSLNITDKYEPGLYAFLVVADGPCGSAIDAYCFAVAPQIATDIAISTEDADGVTDRLRYNKCNDVNLTLLDECGFNAVTGVLDPDCVKVYLTATAVDPKNPTGAPIVAGHFYNCWDCADWSRDNEQINYVRFGQFDSFGSITMVPLVEGEITITATATIGENEIKVSKKVMSVSPKNVDLELIPLATDDNGNARAGWPIAAVVRLYDENGNDISSGANYSVGFTLNGDPVDFQDQLVDRWEGPDYIPPCDRDEFNAAFLADEGADLEGIFPYCTNKWYYMIYTTDDLRNGAEIEVNIDGVGSDKAAVNFVTPVELVRELRPDAWQTFSTPKLLAAPGQETPAFGTFKNLLAPIFAEMKKGPFSADEEELFVLGYRNGAWFDVDKTDEVEPLVGYYVRTPQREKAIMANQPFVLNYVFARATTPSYSTPYGIGYGPNDDIDEGDSTYLQADEWNSIGVGVAPEIRNTMTKQSDDSAQALGSLMKGNGSYLVWNPGTKLGNVNEDFVTNALGGSAYSNNTVNPFIPLYNGDVYWLYGDCSNQYYASNVGLEMIEWIGGNYEPIAQEQEINLPKVSEN